MLLGRFEVIDRLLENGVVVRGSEGTLGAARSNVNGVMPTLMLRDVDTGFEARVLTKPSFAQGAQDRFASGLARAVGAGAQIPAATVRADGTSVEELVPGVEARSVGVRDYAGLEDVAASAILRLRPAMIGDAAKAHAQVQLDRLAAIDFIGGNYDRARGNVMVDPIAGVHFIDFGCAAMTGARMLRPLLHPEYLRGGRTGVQRLDPAVVEDVRRGLTNAEMNRLHTQLRTDLSRQPITGGSRNARGTDRILRSVVTSDRALRGMIARRDELLRTGTIRYRPVNRVNELEVWLVGNAQTHPVWTAGVGAGLVGGFAGAGVAMSRT